MFQHTQWALSYFSKLFVFSADSHSSPFLIIDSLRPPDPSSTIPPKRPPPLSHESWQQERDQVRKSNREHGGVHPIKHKELSKGKRLSIPTHPHASARISIHPFFFFSFCLRPRKVQLDFLACLEQFENMLETSAQICYAYSTLCRTKDWLLIAPTIVDQDTPPQCKVMFTRPFPVDIITQELSSMPDSHLRLDVGLFWGDGEQEEGEGKTCIQHRKYVLREVCRGLLPQLKLEAASPRRTWKEPPHLQCTPSLLRLRPHCGAGGFYDYYPPFSWPWLPPRVGRYFAATSHVGDGSKRFFPRLNFVCTPAGFVSRAHQDEPLSTQVRQWVGYKLWWWFPATPHNQAAWANGMCDTREIDWCIKNLTDLRVVLLGPFEETMIPVGAYHAVFALTPSIHSTMEFLCSTELVQTLTLRQRQIERLAPLVDKMDEAVDDEPAPSYQLARGELRELVEDVPERFFKPFERLFPDDFSNGMQIFEEREEAREYQMGNWQGACCAHC